MGRLTVGEACYLLNVLALDDRLRHALEHAPIPLLDHLTEEQVDALRDACGERLQAVGFDADYEPTEEGRRLETLIDKLMVASTHDAATDEE